MRKKTIYTSTALLCLFAIFWAMPLRDAPDTHRSERVKIAMREVGNQLLLTQGDSTSLILPVKQLEPLKYQLSFERELTFLPDSLVAILDKNFAKAGISKNYIVEVLRCEDREVSYSYEMNMNWDRTIVPCSGRQVPDTCHHIEVLFVQEAASLSAIKIVVFILALGVLGFVLFRFREMHTQGGQTIENKNAIETAGATYKTLGSFRFYPEQNKLVKEAEELSLSRKECELLAIFAARPNEIIKREELTKSVWEDNGVIVGRSLDTYISKLRKLLRADTSIKITNVHGVGYRLELG